MPLWVFVGSTVNAVYSENEEKRSDVLTVARFLHHVLENRDDWVPRVFKNCLMEKAGWPLQTARTSLPGVCGAAGIRSLCAGTVADILARISCTGEQRPASLRNSQQRGELGLRAGGADDYFGLIYIGDTNEFKKLVESDQAGIVLEEDVISDSLFDDINRRNSKINILIGAKKIHGRLELVARLQHGATPILAGGKARRSYSFSAAACGCAERTAPAQAQCGAGGITSAMDKASGNVEHLCRAGQLYGAVS